MTAPMTATALGSVVCHLGEGPVFDAETGTLWWFDILERRLHEMAFPHGATTTHDLPVMASALMRVDGGRQLLVCEDGFYLRDRASGALRLHTPLEADRPGNRSNDARAHPSGAIWAGTMGRNAEPKAGAIYWFRAGEVRRLFAGITIPNSICFSPDGSVAYFTDTDINQLLRVDCDPLTGLPIGEPRVLVDGRGEAGGLDGSVVDADGIVWNARWGAGRVDGYAPDGRRIESISVPARQTTCPAFVGDGLSRMVVTTAYEHMDDEARRQDPLAGRIFLLDRVFRGRREPDVRV